MTKSIARATTSTGSVLRESRACYTRIILVCTARYNPLQILVDDWMDIEKNKDLIADARSISLQLCPEPATTGENTFFRNGSRKYLVFGFVYLKSPITAQVKRP
jgi:hypothetical protein